MKKGGGVKALSVVAATVMAVSSVSMTGSSILQASGDDESLKTIANEVADESIPDNCSLANEIIIKSKEGRKILDKIKQDDYVILLDVAGKELDSIEMAKQIEGCMLSGKSTIDFVIGGSLGHGQELIDRANLRLSFSKMTFPHQLMRLILVEQIYRSFKIIKNETYHK